MAMGLRILGSGSSGNSALIVTAGARVLVDAGFSARRLGRLLAETGESLAQIDAVFLTHEHGDHIAGIEGLKKAFLGPERPILSCPSTRRSAAPR
jgi:phosphoribosyl 1,2-cyclic phosphodiesterase